MCLFILLMPKVIIYSVNSYINGQKNSFNQKYVSNLGGVYADEGEGSAGKLVGIVLHNTET